MKTAILILLLSLSTIASSVMAYLAKEELQRERERMPLIELMHDKRNGDIFLKMDGGDFYYYFKNACGSMPT